MAHEAGVPCDRLPFPLDVCPCCKQGIKQSRGWTWVEVYSLVGGPHGCEMNPDKSVTANFSLCSDLMPVLCPMCNPDQIRAAGLLWVGEKFYPTPEHFIAEGRSQGISKRIKAIPRGFKLGEDWVLLAHPKAILKAPDGDKDEHFVGGIFQVFKPERIEKLLWESEATTNKLADLKDAGITPVIIPDGDKDHQGSVYDREEDDEPVTA